MKKLYLLIILALVFFASCDNKTRHNPNDIINTKIAMDSPKEWSPDEVVSGRYYIPLEYRDESIFKSIDKLLYKNETFYILDREGTRKLLLFNKKGSFLRTIGMQGKGRGEYLTITSFDVASNMDAYVFDHRTKKMLVYDTLGEVKKSIRCDLPAEDFIKLKNGYLFVLVNENWKKDGKIEHEVVVTNESFEIQKQFIRHSKQGFNSKKNNIVLYKTKEGITYHNPLSDNIYVFNVSGDMVKAYDLNFKEESVPGNFKSNYRDFIGSPQREKYSYIESLPYIVNGKIFGNLYRRSDENLSFFCYRLENGDLMEKVISDNYSHVNINFIRGVVNDNALVSEIFISSYQADNLSGLIPRSIVPHIKEGGIVLVMHQVN